MPEDLFSSPLVGGAAAVVGLVVVIVLFRAIFSGKKKKDSLIESSLLVDLSELPRQEEGPFDLRVQNVPGRLGVVVFAPLGSGRPPKNDETFSVLNAIVPGLGAVARRDEPLVQNWPKQVSATGFANILARHLHVPGRDITETNWCLLVGKTKRPDGVMLVGLAIGMEAANRLGVLRLADEMQWLQFLQVDPRAM
jgi:hypothetical protein